MERKFSVKIRYLLAAGLALVWIAALVVPFAAGVRTDTASPSVEASSAQTEHGAHGGHMDKQISEDLNEAIRSGEHSMLGGINGWEESVPGTGKL